MWYELWPNHRLDEARRGLWILPNQSVFLSARALPSWVLNISRDIHSTVFLGNLFQCLTKSQKKNTSLMLKWIFWYFNLCLLAPVSEYHWEDSVSIFFTFHYQKFMHMGKIPLSSLFLKSGKPQLSMLLPFAILKSLQLHEFPEKINLPALLPAIKCIRLNRLTFL